MARSGEVVANYELRRLLGRGAMGEVWLGRHQVSRSLAAVKLLRQDAAQRARNRLLFDGERRTVGRLSHPHIVRLFDVGPDHLVTQYVAGQDLAHRLRSPLDPAAAGRITAQIASALAYAHASGVVHRDVKPSNVLIDHEERAYLTDFGIARVIGDRSSDPAESYMMGTPAYMAPEQRHRPDVGPAADQYALARTLLVMLLGAPAPPGGVQALAALPRDLPLELVDVLARALEHDPARRWPSMDAFAAELAKVDLSRLGPGMPLAPKRRAEGPLAWAARAHRVVSLGPELVRADYRLGDLGMALAGHRELGFSLYARAGRLGEVPSPAAVARASEVIVLLHGALATRESWREVALGLVRDNGHAVVLVPDVHASGETRLEPGFDPEVLSPAGMVRGVVSWLRLLGLDGARTVLVGHSIAAVGLLSVSAAELERGLGHEVDRIALTPFFPFSDGATARYLRVTSVATAAVAMVGPLRRWLAERLVVRGARTQLRPLDERRRMAEILTRWTPREIWALARGGAAARPAPGDLMDRCHIVVSADDPVAREEVLAPGLAALGFPPERLLRLSGGGHNPHAPNEQHPEWTQRHVDEIARVVDAVLDQTRAATPASDGAITETLDR